MTTGEQFLVNVPKTSRGMKTLESISNAAEELFASKGYTETSINDITAKANVAAGTFYIYFESKLSLYKYILVRYNKNVRMKMQQKTQHCTTREEKEREGLRAWFDYLVDHKFLFNITWESFFVDPETFKEYFTSFSKSYVKQLEEAQKNGELRDVDPDILSFILMGISNFVGMQWVIFKGETDSHYPVEQVMDILKHGIFK